MKLMNKIALVFVMATTISSVAYFSIGKSIVDKIDQTELDRGPGRLNAVISKIDSDAGLATAQAREFGEYFSIAYRVDEKYGEGERPDIIQLTSIKDKIMKSSISNMVIVDKDFNVYKDIKVSNIDTKSEEINNLLKKSKQIMDIDENYKKGFGGALIATDNSLYIVGVKSITGVHHESIGYNLSITPLNEEYTQKMSELTDRNIKVIKNDGNIDYTKFKPIKVGENTFGYNQTKDSVDFYTKVHTTIDGPEYLYCLVDNQVGKMDSKKTINMLIIMTIVVTALANIICYKLIMDKVLRRIVKINDAVNHVTNSGVLHINLDDDNNSDEISTLKSDLKDMFKQLKEYSNNLEYIGSHDILTGLINKHTVLEHITKLKHQNKEFAVFFMDLDNFKGINDTMGHDVGDTLLCLVSEKLVNAIDEKTMVVSRFGGDEFIVVREGKNSKKEILKLAEKLLKSISFNYEIDDSIYDIKGSIGISFYPEHSSDEVTLLQYSDIAMYSSKKRGGNVYTIFQDNMLEMVNIESKIKAAIENDEFEVYYQPIYGVNQEDIIGAEALIRWNSPEGMIFPDKFIPLAKRTGDIVDIDMFVLREAIKTCREWIDKGRDEFYISINASSKFLKQKNLVDKIKAELKEKHVPCKAIRLEITEDEIIDDFEATIKLLDEIREIGIQVYLDDFGTGYSSFHYIKVLPVDVVKIDRSLLMDICQNEKSKSIIETMISLCHKLDIKIVCEGVEDFDQVEVLKTLHCDNIQGYYFSRPLQKEKFNEFVSNYK